MPLIFSVFRQERSSARPWCFGKGLRKTRAAISPAIPRKLGEAQSVSRLRTQLEEVGSWPSFLHPHTGRQYETKGAGIPPIRFSAQLATFHTPLSSSLPQRRDVAGSVFPLSSNVDKQDCPSAQQKTSKDS
ncbi:UNVERIFIED_CONTAM: hypothetical protein K2H54_068682 [Gekko kuhli]